MRLTGQQLFRALVSRRSLILESNGLDTLPFLQVLVLSFESHQVEHTKPCHRPLLACLAPQLCGDPVSCPLPAVRSVPSCDCCRTWPHLVRFEETLESRGGRRVGPRQAQGLLDIHFA